MAELWRDYVAGTPALAAFFAGAPQSLFQHPPRMWKPEPQFREALQASQIELGLSRKVPEKAAVIITGQQPGIFTGPAYTIYKAITCIHLAKLMEERTGTPYVPVFWNGADDHDLEEVGTVHLLTKHDTSLPLAYRVAETGRSMFNIPLNEDVHALIEEAADSAAGSELAEEVREFLHEQARGSASVAEWFARLMARLFRDTPLMIFSPNLPEARQLAAPMITRELEQPLETTGLVNDAAARLEQLGYPAQLTKNSNECSFFIEVERRRCKVIFEGQRFRLPEVNLEYSRDELAAMLTAQPERFTPNVALRCVIQQHLFNPAAYVGGPGEIAYWGQFKSVFKHHGLDMPVVYPRVRASLTTLKLKKLQTKLNLTLEDLTMPEEQVVEKALTASVQHPAFAAIAEHRAAMAQHAQSLIESLRKHRLKDQSVLTIAEGIATHLNTNFERLERTLRRSDQAQLETIRKQVTRLCTVLAPERRPQERVYTIFSFLFAHGWELIPRLIAELNSENFEMQEVEL